MNITPQIIDICQKKSFLVSKPLNCDFYLRLKGKIEELEGMKIGAAGTTSDALKRLKDNHPLGAGKLITMEELGLSQSLYYETDKEAYLDAFRQCAAATQHGVLIPVGTVGNWKQWVASEACSEEVKDLPEDRVFGYIEHKETDTGGKKGYIIYMDQESSSASIRDGKGYILWRDGTYYDGEFKKDRKHGKGKMVHANGDVYEGEWENGKRHGKGKYAYANGNVYEGEWENDKKSGDGKCIYENGNVYEGEWKDDKKSGKGKLICKNGDVYEGEWKADQQDGQGKKSFSNGNVYTGSFKNDVFHGNGWFHGIDGEMYNGEWKNGKKDGQGMLQMANGSMYSGFFKDDKFHGQGRYFDASAGTNGNWENGVRTTTPTSNTSTPEVQDNRASKRLRIISPDEVVSNYNHEKE